MIKWLIERGVNFDIIPYDGIPQENILLKYSLSRFDWNLSPIAHSVLNCDKESTALIASQMLTMHYYFLNPLLHVAALFEEESILRSLLKNEGMKAEINSDTIKSDIFAYITREERISLFFLNTAKIDLSVLDNKTSSYQWNVCTPLHIAIAFQRMNNIRVLLDNGAAPHYRPVKSFSPFMFALLKRDIKIVKLFLERKMDQTTLEDRALCLSLAAMGEDSSLLALLLQNKAFIDAINTLSFSLIYVIFMKGTRYALCDCTPLHAAIESQCTDNIRLLLENGADPNVCNRYGPHFHEPSPLMFAILQGNLPTVKLLLEKGLFIR